MALGNKQTCLYALNNLPSQINNESYKSKSMSLGLIPLEENTLECHNALIMKTKISNLGLQNCFDWGLSSSTMLVGVPPGLCGSAPHSG